MVGFDVPVAKALVPIAQEGVAELVLEVVDDAALGLGLALSDFGHGGLRGSSSAAGSGSDAEQLSTLQ